MTTTKNVTIKKKTTTAKAEPSVTKTQKVDISQETLEKNTTSLLGSIDKSLFIRKAKGGTKDSFLKENLFNGMGEKEQKASRRKIRTTLHKFSESFKFYHDEKDVKNLKALKQEFDKFYATVFKTNDYSVGSIAGNVKPKVKEEFQGMLNIIKGIK